jgi:hypothetical protein
MTLAEIFRPAPWIRRDVRQLSRFAPRALRWLRPILIGWAAGLVLGYCAYRWGPVRTEDNEPAWFTSVSYSLDGQTDVSTGFIKGDPELAPLMFALAGIACGFLWKAGKMVVAKFGGHPPSPDEQPTDSRPAFTR